MAVDNDNTSPRDSAARPSEHNLPLPSEGEGRGEGDRAPRRHDGATQSSALSPQSYQADDEISLLDILIVLAKHKKLILGLPLLVAIVTAGITLLMPNIYTARAVIMPPQQQQSTAAAMLGQLGALAGVAGSSLGIKNPNDLYVGILKSRSIADALIERFKLKELYETQALDDARQALAGNTAATAGRDGLIVVQVDDEDPKRAADMANAYMAYIETLEQALGKIAEENYLPMQLGDVPATAADTGELNAWVGFKPNTPVKVGVARFVEWYRNFYNVRG